MDSQTVLPPRAKLANCSTLDQLASLLNTEVDKLLKLIYPHNRQYISFSIPKKDGSRRLISTPKPTLKNYQMIIASELHHHYIPRASAHAFIEQKSVLTNASPHVNKRYVLNLDLEDFFGTITFGRVKRLLQSPPLSLTHNVATVVAHICCYKGRLPQGAPSSPIISNMIAFKLDNQLLKLAKQYRFTYTRYADDITLSFNQKRKTSLPTDIVKFDEDSLALGRLLLRTIESNGFSVNDDKTRLATKNDRQAVTNLTVNQFVNVNRLFLRQTSAMINALNVYGAQDAEIEYLKKYHKGYLSPRKQLKHKNEPGKFFKQMVRGILNFIRMVKGKDSLVWRKLMYRYTVAIGEPNARYALSPAELAKRSLFVIHNLTDDSEGVGTGFKLNTFGMVTNQHVIAYLDNSNLADFCVIEWIEKMDQQFPSVQLILSDEKSDIAIVEGASMNIVPALDASTSPDYTPGTTCTLLGFPNYKTEDSPTVIECRIVREIEVDNEPRIVVDEKVTHGMSGGPVIDSDGLVIGIISNGSKYNSTDDRVNAFIPIKTLLLTKN
ncbi:reverse transcriptase domain-containing protein [Idiomarina piscisalsi]|uniref:reverse transcriptase domain-containing protein n=1 Tax=Idiomarina piscisalsi TaxID=1096243 RepID=UPI003632880D